MKGSAVSLSPLLLTLPNRPRQLPGEQPLKLSHLFFDISDYLSGRAAFLRSKWENLEENSHVALSCCDREGRLTPERLLPSSPREVPQPQPQGWLSLPLSSSLLLPSLPSTQEGAKVLLPRGYTKALSRESQIQGLKMSPTQRGC